jgi:hypothetical protein
MVTAFVVVLWSAVAFIEVKLIVVLVFGWRVPNAGPTVNQVAPEFAV